MTIRFIIKTQAECLPRNSHRREVAKKRVPVYVRIRDGRCINLASWTLFAARTADLSFMLIRRSSCSLCFIPFQNPVSFYQVRSCFGMINFIFYESFWSEFPLSSVT